MTLTIGICRISPDCCIRVIVTFYFGAASVSYHDNPCKQTLNGNNRHLEIMHVILSAAKDLGVRLARSFAALRMTCRTPLKAAHEKSYLQMSRERYSWLC